MNMKDVYLLKYNGYVDVDGNGYVDVDGDVDGYGDGNGNGYGDGYGDGNGNGDGDGDGNGDGNGYGDGDGDGDGDGNGYGDGDGNGYGDGDGNGNGNGIYMAKIFGSWYEVYGEIENSICNNIHPDHFGKIDSTFIKNVTNVESLRILRDKIGLGRYLELLQAKVVNEEMDYQGNQMRLLKCDENGETSLLLEVVCPSTMRKFHLYPPNQKAKTCFEAKASTFKNKPLAVRHGDVGLFRVDGKKITVPFSET